MPFNDPWDGMYEPAELALPESWRHEPDETMPLRYRLHCAEYLRHNRHVATDDAPGWQAPAAAGLWYLAEVPRSTFVWPLVAEFAAVRAVAVRDGLPGPEVWLRPQGAPGRPLPTPGETPEVKYYLSQAPADTPLATLVRVSGLRWPIKACFEEGKEEVGLDHYELRFWRGWYHHMMLVLLAHHFLVRLQRRLDQRGGDQQQATDPSLPLPLSPPPLSPPPVSVQPAPVVCLDGVDRREHPRRLPLPPLVLPSLPQVRQLLRALLPLPSFNLTAALALVAHQQHHNIAAYRSHRKRTLRRLVGQGP
jgi:hypothetical protein